MLKSELLKRRSSGRAARHSRLLRADALRLAAAGAAGELSGFANRIAKGRAKGGAGEFFNAQAHVARAMGEGGEFLTRNRRGMGKANGFRNALFMVHGDHHAP